MEQENGESVRRKKMRRGEDVGWIGRGRSDIGRCPHFSDRNPLNVENPIVPGWINSQRIDETHEKKINTNKGRMKWFNKKKREVNSSVVKRVRTIEK